MTTASAADTYSVSISNVDENGNQMAGCEFAIYKDGSLVQTFTSTDTAAEVSLEAGDYVLKQTSVPSPYMLAEDASFTVESDGHVVNNSGKKYYVKNLDLTFNYPPRGTDYIYTRNGKEGQYYDVDGNIVPWSSSYHATMMRLTNPDEGGIEYVYCFNKSKAAPDNYAGETPTYYSQNSTPQLFSDHADTLNGTAEEAYLHVLGILENGFPNSTSLQSQYNLTDQQFYAVTQWAIWYYTDSVEYSNDLHFSTTDKPDGDEYTDDWTEDMFSAYQYLLEQSYSGEQTAEFFTTQSQLDGEDFQNVIGARFVAKTQTVTIANVKPLSVYKVDDSGEAVSGAVLQLRQYPFDSDDIIETWTTDGSAHTIDLSSLAVNEQYKVQESTTPDGYKKATSRTFKTDGSYLYLLQYVYGKGYTWVKQDDPVIRMIDTKLHTVSVKKVDGDSGETVPGAELELLRVTSTGQTSVDTWTTDGSDHEISGLIPATYKLAERTAPDGYQTADTITFRLGKDGMIHLIDAEGNESEAQEAVITMKDYKPAVTFNKVDADTGEALSGAKLTLVQGENADGTAADEWTTDGSAHKVTGLQEGTYTLVETEAPSGYETAAAITFRLDADQKIHLQQSDGTESEAQEAVITMEDEKTPVANTYAVRFRKIDANSGGAVTCAELELVYGRGTGGTSMEAWTTDGTDHEISGLVPGTYTLIERTAPNGYQLADPITFRLDEAGKIHLTESDGTESEAQEAVITMEDEKTPVANTYAVRFKKIDADSGKAVTGARLKLVHGRGTGGTSVKAWKTSGNVHEISGLVPGTYTLIERRAPNRYELADPITFRLDEAGKIHLTKSDSTESDAQEAVITMEDEKTSVKKTSAANTYAVRFRKIDADSGKAVTGARLELVHGRGTGGTSVKAWKTDGDIHEISSLVPGTYTLIERRAPNGYELADPITFRLDKAGKIHLTESDGTESDAQEAVITMKDMRTSGVDGPVDTGDNSGMFMWILITAGSAVALLWMLHIRLRRSF
ncbi:MAG: SpaA isopeptide-forming pilin-related protein [Anaerovoracaceae bacterium]